MLSIRAKLTLTYTALFGILLVAFSFVIYHRLKEAEIVRLDARLESAADRIATEFEENADERQLPDSLKMNLLAREGSSDARFDICDTTGATVFGQGFVHLPMPAVRWGKEGTGQTSDRELRIDGDAYRLVMLSSDPEDSLRYIVRVAGPKKEIDDRMRDLQLLFLGGLPLALLVTAFAAWQISGRAFRPVVDMVRSAERISSSNLGQRLAVPMSHDEIRTLADALNGMIARLENAFRSQQQFVADASHEFRTPLTVIASELEYAEERIQDVGLKEGLQAAIAEADRLGRLTENLLLLARMDADRLRLRLEPLRIDELTVDAARSVKAMAEQKNISLRFDIADAGEVLGDRDRLTSVFANLLDNAIKYSPPGSTVTVSIQLSPSDRTFRIGVADEGPGIPEKIIPHLFDRFYRGDESREGRGHGLGLAIVRQLVQLHGGTVSVESTPGRGSTFTVVLPEHLPA